MSDWLEHTIQVEVEAPMNLIWGLWSDLEQMPRWMKWIDSVTVPENDPEISLWKLSSNGLEFTWRSRILKKVPCQIIEWQSIDGLPNRGAIRFYDRKTSSIVKMTVGYAIPGIIGKIMDNLFLGKVVESTLDADLQRFKLYALDAKARVGKD
jgi:uncharacterized membrane protein